MPEEPSTREILLTGDIEVKGRMPWSSNATFLVEACKLGATAAAIYKPERGERPLWDFPSGLHRREVAAYELSETLGWGIVPLTVRRLHTAPHGEGSLQEFIDADFDEHYFTLLEDESRHEQLRVICAFDLVANSADRKAGHVLLGPDDRLYAIDNGLSFHTEVKVRTVIWDFAGQPVPARLVADLERLVQEGLPDSFDRLLDPDECSAVVARARALAREAVYPVDPTGRRYPWPLV